MMPREEDHGTLLKKELRQFYAAIEDVKGQHSNVLREILPSSLDGLEKHVDSESGRAFRRVRLTMKRRRKDRKPM